MTEFKTVLVKFQDKNDKTQREYKMVSLVCIATVLCQPLNCSNEIPSCTGTRIMGIL